MSEPGHVPTRGVHIQVCADALRHNISQVRAHCPSSRILAVVKANAYGHGLEGVAKILAPRVDGLGVARIEEAIRVRECGITDLPLLVLGPTRSVDAFRQCVRHGLDVVVQDEEEIEMLTRLPNSCRLRVWLKMDCGLHRLGFEAQHYRAALEKVLALVQVRSVIAMTHFSSSTDDDLDITRAQLQRFLDLDHGGTEGLSSANSGAICRLSDAHLDWVRPGLLVYGVNPEPRVISGLSLRPAMRFSAPIIAMREIAAGEPVGYGCVWRAGRRSLIATVGAGYADGYPCFDRDCEVYAYAHGSRVAVVGQVSMDMLAVDLTDYPAARIGDQVELWGENVTANEVSASTQRRLYTLLTGISDRVARSYD